jgi:hypothetical protein
MNRRIIMVKNCGVDVDPETMKPLLTIKVDIEALQDRIALNGESNVGAEMGIILGQMIHETLKLCEE